MLNTSGYIASVQSLYRLLYQQPLRYTLSKHYIEDCVEEHYNHV
jgi:hypothetical protein